MSQSLQNKIPEIYHSFFEPILSLDYPEETIATCADCTLCRAHQSPYINTKCCTYYPFLANYLVGGILKNQFGFLSRGQERVSQLIAARKGISPYGIVPTTVYRQNEKKHNLRKKALFVGAKEEYEALLCPYYDGGDCTIWAFRENLCVTHFCTSIGGARGKFFWKKLNDYITLAEQELSKYALLQLGWPAAEIDIKALRSKEIQIDDAAGKINEIKYQTLWRDWIGQEEKFYIACYEIIQGLSREKFQQILGQNGEILEVAIQETARVFQESVLPNHLVLHPAVRIEPSSIEGQCVLLLDEKQVEIPVVILPLVKAFNGQRSIFEVFDLGFRVMYNMSSIIDELRSKGMLIKV